MYSPRHRVQILQVLRYERARRKLGEHPKNGLWKHALDWPGGRALWLLGGSGARYRVEPR